MKSDRHIAHPTAYRGCQFRSRLEASWAAFFDLAGWAWEYEPFDLDGWVPDFALRGQANTVLVEVKPITWSGREPEQVLQERGLEKVLAHRTETMAPDALKTEILVCGVGPQRVDSDWVLGAFVDESWGGPDWAVLCHGTAAPFDFCAQRGSFAYRIGGEWDGDHHLRPIDVGNIEPTLAWRRANAATQWKGAAATPYEGPVGPILNNIISKLRGGWQ